MRRTLVALFLLCLFVGASVGPVAAVSAPAEAIQDHQQNASSDGDVSPGSTTSGEITYLSLDGRGYVHGQEGIVKDHSGQSYVWASESLLARLTIRVRPSTNGKEICGRALNENREAIASLGCSRWNSSSRWQRTTLELSEWPAGANDTHYLKFEYAEVIPVDNGTTDTRDSGTAADSADGTDRALLDSREVDVLVIEKQGDIDDDGLSNAREVSLGTDFTRPDSDDDGLSDSVEVYQYGSDPLAGDTTGDGLADGTVAGIGLPPTVPYVVHAVALGVLLATIAVAVGAVKLLGVLERSVGQTSPAASSQPTGGSPPSQLPPGAEGEPRSKEEEVYHVISEHGGRMRQADLVDEIEWSKATVSRLLSSLEEEGRVEKIRVGRGNVVRLTGESTDDANLAGTANEQG